MVVGVFRRIVEQKLEQLRSLQATETTGLIRQNVFQEVVDVTHSDAHHIDDDRVAEEQGEGEEDPGKIRRLEGDEAEEVHPNHRIPTRPNVDQHDRERLTQKYLIGEDGEEGHYGSAKEEHEEEIGSPSAEGVLFEHSTVSVREDHVEQEIEAYGSKKHEIGD